MVADPADGRLTWDRPLSEPVLNYPAPMHGALRAKLQFAGTTVDGESSAVYPPLAESDVRY